MTAEGGEAEASGREAEASGREAVEALGFEVAMAELEEIVRRLESGEVELEASIAMYERGALLKRHCEAKLRAATEKVERLVVGSDGEVRATESADIE